MPEVTHIHASDAAVVLHHLVGCEERLTKELARGLERTPLLSLAHVGPAKGDKESAGAEKVIPLFPIRPTERIDDEIGAHSIGERLGPLDIIFAAIVDGVMTAELADEVVLRSGSRADNRHIGDSTGELDRRGSNASCRHMDEDRIAWKESMDAKEDVVGRDVIHRDGRRLFEAHRLGDLEEMSGRGTYLRRMGSEA